MNTFIAQTAKDYDMSYEDVEFIYRHHKDEFYKKLEEYIKERNKDQTE